MKKKITMTARQAARMNTPGLAGKGILCIMPTKKELEDGHNPNIARGVYFEGSRIGRGMSVDK